MIEDVETFVSGAISVVVRTIRDDARSGSAVVDSVVEPIPGRLIGESDDARGLELSRPSPMRLADQVVSM